MDSLLIAHFYNKSILFSLFLAFIKSFVLLHILLVLVSLSVYMERKMSAFIQDRIGPNRVGLPLTLFGGKRDIFLWGLGQMIADPIKLLTKENFIPASVNKFYFWLAPKLVMIPPILVLAVLPYGSSLFGVKMVIADLNVAVLYIFAVSSLSVYGITLAGWASNSKFPFLGGIRSSSQMISYELALGLALIPIFMITGSVNLTDIVDWQIHHGWFIFPFFDLNFSTILWQEIGRHILLWISFLVSFIVFLIAIFAETNRLPFDLPEAEQELVGGYHTEYSSMNFALFFLGEYAAMVAGAGAIVSLFFGGWSLPGIPDGSAGTMWGIINIAIFFIKVSLFLLFFIWVRWTLPRFRYDQLMRLGWLAFFPIALGNVFFTALILAFT